MWAARDKNEELHLFLIKPERCNEEGVWDTGDWEYPESESLLVYSDLIPNLKWEDEPVEIGIYRTDIMMAISKKNME